LCFQILRRRKIKIQTNEKGYDDDGVLIFCQDWPYSPTILKKMKTSLLLFLLVTLCAVACTKEKTEEESPSAKIIFEEISTYTDYTFYKGDSTIVHSSPQSGHNAFFRVRFNKIAAAALTDSGKLPVNGTFPEGSIIVKDLYNTQTGAKVLYSVLKKNSMNANATNGWLWIEFEPNGNEIYKITNKGDGCVSCHSNNHRDNVRVFNLF
jgi:hypothetical protein